MPKADIHEKGPGWKQIITFKGDYGTYSVEVPSVEAPIRGMVAVRPKD